MGKLVDLTGQRFGKLTVIEKTDIRSCRAVMWKCLCDCGNITYVNRGNLNNGAVRSCGCILSEKGKKLAMHASASRARTDITIIDNIDDRAVNKNNKLGIKGVCYDKSRGKYKTEIMLNYKPIFIGRFDTLSEAIEARKLAEEKYFKPIIQEYRQQAVSE